MSHSRITFDTNGALAGRSHCPMALVPGSAPQFSQEVACPLRRRLPLAGPIGFLGFGVFLVRNLLQDDDAIPRLLMAFHIGVVAVLTACCGMLWSNLPLSMRALRTIEVVCFGAMALFFAYAQLVVLNPVTVQAWAQPEHLEHVLSLAGAANSLRWCILIVLYGTFIPNTWRRCAVMVGALALLPLLLTFFACAVCPVVGPHTPPRLF